MFKREDFAITQQRFIEGRCPCCGDRNLDNWPGAERKVINEAKNVVICAHCVHCGHDSKNIVAEIMYLLAG